MESRIHISLYLQLVNWMYLYSRADIHLKTWIRCRSIQTPSRYLFSHWLFQCGEPLFLYVDCCIIYHFFNYRKLIMDTISERAGESINIQFLQLFIMTTELLVKKIVHIVTLQVFLVFFIQLNLFLSSKTFHHPIQT